MDWNSVDENNHLGILGQLGLAPLLHRSHCLQDQFARTVIPSRGDRGWVHHTALLHGSGRALPNRQRFVGTQFPSISLGNEHALDETDMSSVSAT